MNNGISLSVSSNPFVVVTAVQDSIGAVTNLVAISAGRVFRRA